MFRYSYSSLFPTKQEEKPGQMIECRVAGCIDRRDILPNPAHVGGPCQRGTPCSTRRQYENSGEDSYPVHTDTPLLALTGAGRPFLEKTTSHMEGLCRIAELTPSSEERLKRGNHSPLPVAATQGACRRGRRIIRTKISKIGD